MSQRVFISVAGALLAALSLSACGGGGDDEQPAIKRAVTQAITTRNAATRCEQLSTTSFVTRVYGDIAQCRRAEKPEADDEPATGAAVSAVKVDGDSATARVRVSGGTNDGATGTLDLRKQDGDWRIDDLGVDFLRSEVRTGLTKSGGKSGLDDPAVKSCATKAFLDLPDPELKRIAYLAIAETDEGNAQVGKLLGPCLKIPGSGSAHTSVLRKQFESGITARAHKDGMTQSTIDCINTDLRSSISDDQISKLAFNGAKPTAAMKRKIVEAFGRCQGHKGSQGATVLRELFETGVRKGAAQRHLPKQVVTCVLQRLRSTISDGDIVAATTSAAKKAQLSRRTAAELVRCGAVKR